MRTSGILLPVASLPGNYGIGGFSEEAYRFVDFLAEAGQRWWQILPLGPTGYGDSPYQSFSTYAGNPYYISLDELIREGLLTQQEADEADCGQNPGYVEYEKIWETRFAVLRKACGRFKPDEGFRRFAAEQGEWLEDYCLYCAVKASMKHVGWLEWPEALRDRDAAELNRFREGHEDEIGFYRFL